MGSNGKLEVAEEAGGRMVSGGEYVVSRDREDMASGKDERVPKSHACLLVLDKVCDLLGDEMSGRGGTK